MVPCEKGCNRLSTAPGREVEKCFQRFMQKALGLPTVSLVQESKQIWKASVALLPEYFGIEMATSLVGFAPQSAEYSGHSELTPVIRN